MQTIHIASTCGSSSLYIFSLVHVCKLRSKGWKSDEVFHIIENILKFSEKKDMNSGQAHLEKYQ